MNKIKAVEELVQKASVNLLQYCWLKTVGVCYVLACLFNFNIAREQAVEAFKPLLCKCLRLRYKTANQLQSYVWEWHKHLTDRTQNILSSDKQS